MPNITIKELINLLSKINSILFSVNVNFLSSVPVPVKPAKDFKPGEYYLPPIIMEKIVEDYDRIEVQLKEAKDLFSSILPHLKYFVKNPKLLNDSRDVFNNIFTLKSTVLSADLDRKKYALFTLKLNINSLINVIHSIENNIFVKFQSDCIPVFETVISRLKIMFNTYLFLRLDSSRIIMIGELAEEIKSKISSLVSMYDSSLPKSDDVFNLFTISGNNITSFVESAKKTDWKKLSSNEKEMFLNSCKSQLLQFNHSCFCVMNRLSAIARFEYGLETPKNEIINILKAKVPFKPVEKISASELKLFTNLRNDFEKTLQRFKDEYYTIFTESYHLGYANEFFSTRIEELKSRAQSIVNTYNIEEVKQKYDYVLYDFSHNLKPLLQRKITIFNFADFVKKLNEFLFFGSDLEPSLISFLNKFVFKKLGIGEIRAEPLNPEFQIKRIKERVEGLNVFSFEIARVYSKLKYAVKKEEVENLVNKLFDLLNGFKMQFEAVLRACDLFDQYKSVRDDFNSIIFFIRDKKKGVRETGDLGRFVADILFRLQERYDIVVLVHIKEIINDKILGELNLKREVVFDPKLLTKIEDAEEKLEKLKKSISELRFDGVSFLSNDQVKYINNSLVTLNGYKEGLKKENVPILTLEVVRSILKILDIISNLFKYDYSNALNIPVAMEKYYKHYLEVMNEIYSFVPQKNKEVFSKLLAEFNLLYKKYKFVIEKSITQMGVLDRAISDQVSTARSYFIRNPNSLYACADVLHSLLSPSPRKLSLLELRAKNFVNIPSKHYLGFLKEISIILTKTLELTRN